MTVVALIIATPACNVHLCTISFDLWAQRYLKVDESAIDIVITRNRYEC